MTDDIKIQIFVLLLQVLQYKKRCGDLEQMLQERSSELEKHRLSVSGVYFLNIKEANVYPIGK